MRHRAREFSNSSGISRKTLSEQGCCKENIDTVYLGAFARERQFIFDSMSYANLIENSTVITIQNLNALKLLSDIYKKKGIIKR